MIELNHNQLNDRRKRLGMTYQSLATRCGLSVSTVKRILLHGIDNASFAKVLAIMSALGIALNPTPRPEVEFREEQAEIKARRLTKLTQGTSALESQGLDEDQLRDMTRETTHQLMAGSKRKLWS